MIPLQQGLFSYCGGQKGNSSCVDLLLSEVKSSVRRPSTTSLFTGASDGLLLFIQGNERGNKCLRFTVAPKSIISSQINGFHMQKKLS